MTEKLQKRRKSNDWMEIYLDDDVIMTTWRYSVANFRYFGSVSNLTVLYENSKLRAIPICNNEFQSWKPYFIRVEKKTYLFFLLVAENPFDVQFAMPLFCYVMEMGKKYFA